MEEARASAAAEANVVSDDDEEYELVIHREQTKVGTTLKWVVLILLIARIYLGR